MRLDLVVPHLSAVLLALVIIGLLVRRRERLCWSFLAYCSACLIGNRLSMHWPEQFFTPGFVALKEAVYNVLKLAIVTEIGLRAFESFPRARRHMLVIMLGFGVLASAAVLVGHEQGDAYWSLVAVQTARNQAVLAALFALVVGTARFYRLPLHSFHRGLLIGFALYLATYTSGLAVLRWFGWDAGYPYYLAIDRISYAATVGVWAWTAWRRLPALSPMMLRLQPWAAASR